MHPLQAVRLLTHLGPGWCVFRVRYALLVRLGLLARRAPLAPWSAFANDFAEGRLPSAETTFAYPQDNDLMAEAAALATGVFRLYSAHDIDCGFPPAWNRNPFTGETPTTDSHWSRIPDFGGGDIKDVWELSRFPWAFPLVRAFARDGRPEHAETFWRLFESWQAANPPNRGPQWKCGQEATFRLMAAAFARHAFAGCAATTPSRLAAWRAFVLATARRIGANLDYALSQSNNHGVSECVGLASCALLLPGDTDSPQRLRRGMNALRAQLEELVYADGSFAQHSVNYHRVMLHDLCWIAALLRANGHATPDWLDEAAGRALTWLEAMTDPDTGLAPCAGSNDGAHILPLAPGGYTDFRPACALAGALFRKTLPARPGPWDEAAAWLAPGVSRRATPAEKPAAAWHAPEGGWHILRSDDARLLLRAPEKFRHRPAQADLLHVDLWWRGMNLLCDPGTFSYNARGAFASALKDARVHNTVTFDGAEPLLKAGRFLYLPWPSGSVREEPGPALVATHDGWRRLGASHGRRVFRQNDTWVFEDRLRTQSPRTARLHWLLADLPHEFDPAGRTLRLSTPEGTATLRWTAPESSAATLVRADAGSDRGWISTHYRRTSPALSLAVEVPVHGELTLVTEISF